MSKKAVVLLAEGFEEIEAVTPIDILRRAGVEVTIAGLGSLEVTGAKGITLKADIELEKYKELPDAVILPGGSQGASNLGHSEAVRALLLRMNENQKIIAAICAAPAMTLVKPGILNGKTATCYPGYEKNFTASTRFSEARVVKDGRVITSRGPGTALEFSLELVRQLVDEATAETILQKTLAKV